MCLQVDKEKLLKIIEELKVFECEKIKCIEEKYCKRITELQCELERKEQACCKLSIENDALVKENDYLKCQLKTKDRELERKNEEIRQLKAKNENLDHEIELYKSEIEKWKRKLKVRMNPAFDYSTVYFIKTSIIFVTGSS